MKLLIRNLARTTTEAEIRKMFEVHGSVQSCNLVSDKLTGNSKGFAFIEMPRPGDAKAAVKTLNGKTLDGKIVRVKKATPKKPVAEKPPTNDMDIKTSLPEKTDHTKLQKEQQKEPINERQKKAAPIKTGDTKKTVNQKIWSSNG